MGKGAPVPVLVSVNVGLPRDVAWQGRTVHTGVWKQPVAGPQMVRRLNIDGDGQGDTAGHGGEQRAVLVYQLDSYRHWQHHFGRDDLTAGSFGENLTVDGLPDDEVCIGDRYRIGEAEFEVTQPRVTCYRVGLRVGEPELPALLVSHHRPGFYMRVIRKGRIQAGDEIVATRSGPGRLTVADVDALLYLPDPDPAQLRAALQIPTLSPGWQGSFHDLLTVASAAPSADGPPRAHDPAWAAFRPLRVVDVVAETARAASVHLAAPDGTPLPAARAGQFLPLRFPGAATPAPVRTYSLSSPPGGDVYRITVKQEPHGVVSRYVTTELRPDDVLEAAAPRGDFVLDAGASPVLLLSAGIGVTPLVAMLHELAARTNPRPIWWIHTARGPAEHALAAEAHALLAALPHASEHLFFTAATDEERRRAQAASGRPAAADLARLALPTDAHAYLCGPAPFMAAMGDALLGLGLDPARIHTELFGAMPSITPGIAGPRPVAPHQPPGPPGTGPLVTFARSGIATPFPASTRSVLELAEACDVNARWSCRTGVCHTCTTPLLSGDVAYAPDPLSPPPPGEVLVCCTRPTTDVVLDM